MEFTEPVDDDLIAEAMSPGTGRVMVYRLNGHPYFVGAKLVLRTPVKYKGEWCVRDNGRRPLRAATKDNIFTT